MFLDVAVASLVAAMSPGPDFLVVYKNLTQRGPRHAYACVAGLGLGLVLHCALAYAGVGAFLQQGRGALGALQLLGGGYLGYLGIRALTADGAGAEGSAASVRQSAWRSGGEGFASNVLNPKALLFVVAMTTHLFAQLSQPTQRILALCELPLVGVVWFTFLVTMARTSRACAWIGRLRPWIDKGAGAVFLVLASCLLRSGYVELVT